jgi:hypothetical protein
VVAADGGQQEQRQQQHTEMTVIRANTPARVDVTFPTASAGSLLNASQGVDT